jgi:phytoene dehydrogenase-like protein
MEPKSAREADFIIVGSGINALVCAAMLGGKGHEVLLLERNDRVGGCIRTDQPIAPGFLHDIMATTFVLFVTSPAFAELGPKLVERGLAFANAETPTGVLLPDGRHAVLSTTRDKNIEAFDGLYPGDGATFKQEMDAFGADATMVFAILGGQLWSSSMLRLLARELWRRGPRGLAAFFGEALVGARAYLESRYRSDLIRALFAPWVLHCGLNPENATSGEMAKVIAFALEAAGAPIVRGGAQQLLAAFEQLITDQGGTIMTSAEVKEIELRGSVYASGVVLADGRSLSARRGVICSTSPQQLYESLLPANTVTPDVKASLGAYRYGKANMQMHYALRTPPRWQHPALSQVALLHLTPGLDGVSRAANEAERGLLPAEPTICVGQPVALDPTRAPQGQSILWIQLPECPRSIKGDAAGEIAAPAEGRWTDDVRQRFADRVERLLERHLVGFKETIIGRRDYSPVDLETLNINLVGGDPYGGLCSIDQSFIWRPFKSSVNHLTPIKRLYHIGAATHPGPGLGGGSGYLLAKSLR